ncbi:MAG: HpcH/HpaI aldolase family protein [Aestuariivirga sp.]
MSAPVRSARVRLAGWLAIPEPLVVEIAARTAFDWIGFDLQHGAWDLATAFRGIQLADAIGKPVLIRLPDEQLALIPRVLDHGASGVVLAMASEPEVVRGAVERSRYQPHGTRSYGGQRYGLRPEPADVAEVRPGIHAMLETERGVAAADEIAAIEGLAGIHVGPTDLGLALGLGRDLSAPAFQGAIERIVAAAHAHGLPVTMHAVAARDAVRWAALGFDEVVLTADVELLRNAFTELRREAAAALGEEAAAGSGRDGGYMA